MRKNEIKRTVEEVVRVEYIAEDGAIFRDEAECKKYEESALFAVSKRLKKLNTKWTGQNDFNGNNYDEDEVEIFDVQTDDDLENLRRYLYLKAMQNGASESTIKTCFTSEDGARTDYVFDNVTVGHEVIIFWSYELDWFRVYKDGSLDGYFSWVRDNYNKIITPKEEANQ